MTNFDIFIEGLPKIHWISWVVIGFTIFYVLYNWRSNIFRMHDYKKAAKKKRDQELYNKWKP